MQKPSIGRIVHYIPADEEKRANNGTSPIAAVIVAVWSDTCVNLKLLTDGTADIWKTSVLLLEGPDDETAVYRWKWPERA
jgi:hypothetical protein